MEPEMPRASLEGGDLPGYPCFFQDQENSGDRGGWRRRQGVAPRRGSVISWCESGVAAKSFVNSPSLENGRSLIFELGSQNPGTPSSCPFSSPSLSNEAALHALCVYDSGAKAVCTSEVNILCWGGDLAKSSFTLEPWSCRACDVRGMCTCLHLHASVLTHTYAPVCVSACRINKTFKIQNSVLIVIKNSLSPNLKSDWVKTTSLLRLARKRVGGLLNVSPEVRHRQIQESKNRSPA